MNIVMYFDGNKNSSGTSCSYRLQAGKMVRRETIKLSDMTVPAAEYNGLIKGLEVLKKEFYPKIDLTIYGDNKVVINQVAQRWETKKTYLRQYRDEALNILENLHSYRIFWKPRGENKAG